MNEALNLLALPQVGLFAIIQHWMYLIPRSAPVVMKALVANGDYFPLVNRVDVSYNVLNIPHYFPAHSESEVCVQLDKCAIAISELLRLIKDESVPLNYITEVQFACYYFYSYY